MLESNLRPGLGLKNTNRYGGVPEVNQKRMTVPTYNAKVGARTSRESNNDQVRYLAWEESFSNLYGKSNES